MFELHHGDNGPLDVKVSSETAEVQMGLGDHEMVSLIPPQDGLEIETIEGKVWLTQTGDPMDHVLGEHQSFETHARGAVVVQGLTDATFRMRKPKPA